MIFKRNIPLRRFLRLSLLASLGLSGLFWNYLLFSHFFEFEWVDRLSLLLAVILPAGLILPFRRKLKTLSLVWVIPVIATTFLLFPALRFFISVFELSWLLPHAHLVVLSLTLVCFRSSKGAIALLTCSLPVVWLVPYDMDQNQQLYYDTVVSSTQTRKAEIHRVRWKDELWTHYNGRLSYATVDRHIYYEAMAHPAMHLQLGKRTLVIGGDNGQLLAELVKYPNLRITVLPWDIEFLNQSNPDPRLKIVPTSNALDYLASEAGSYDYIYIDIPDPISLELNQYYTREFYSLCKRVLSTDGLLVTQALNPYDPGGHHYIIQSTLEEAGFTTRAYHCQIPTLGQWAWLIAGTSAIESHLFLPKQQLVATKWWNKEAMEMMLSFGKRSFFTSVSTAVNTMDEPILQERLSRKE